MRIPGLRRLPRLRSTKRSIERDVDDEMRFHLQMRIEDLMRQGRSSNDARSTAAAEFGDVTAARAELASIDRRHARNGAWREWLASIGQDVRFGFRGLKARPGFSITILLTLALGIGANAAIFSVVDAVLLRPLPYAKPDRLIAIWEQFESKVDQRSEASYPDYLDWRARTKTLAELGGYHGAGFVYGRAQPITVPGAKVTANFMDVLGVHPILGRNFAAGEDAVGAPHVAMLTYGFWERELGSNPEIIGKSIMLDGAPYHVVGVLPKGFQLAGRTAGAQIITPVDRNEQSREQRGSHWINIIARIRDGATMENVRQDMSSVMKQLEREYPASNTGRTPQIVPLQEEMVGTVKPILLLLYGAVVVVLLVACVNVANLLLMRGAERKREIAVRIALGAGKSRLVRQLLTESVMLSVCGGVLGLVIARTALHWLIGLIPTQQLRLFPALATAGLDARVVVYALAVSLLAGIGFGLFPAFRMTKAALHSTLKSAARGAIGGESRLRDTLVIGELALTVMLMSGALLFGRSLIRLLSIDPGFQAEHVVSATVILPGNQYADDVSIIAFFQRYLDGLRGAPGIESVGMTSKLPLDCGNSLGFSIVGQPPRTEGNDPTASYRTVSPDYFRTLEIPIISGRVIGAGDDAHSPWVGVVNRAFVKAYLGKLDPVGQMLSLRTDTIRIVGVVGDVPIGRVEETVPPTLYLQFPRMTQPAMAVVVRTKVGVGSASTMMRQTLSAIDPNAAMTPVTSMEDVIANSPSVFMRRFPLYLVGAFAATALLLAIVGIYGVVSYSVAQRSREMGIRMALGAQPGSLVGLVVRHGGIMAAAGIILGVSGALILGRFAATMLYGVGPGDPVTYISVSAVLAGVAVGATIVPARRATKVDPALALRSD
jgi:putative ABC transport system permease protein